MYFYPSYVSIQGKELAFTLLKWKSYQSGELFHYSLPAIFLLLFSFCFSAKSEAVQGDLTVYTNRGDLLDGGHYSRWITQFKRLYPKVNQVKIIRSDNFETESTRLFAERRYGDVTLVPENIPKDLYPIYFVPLNDLDLSKHLYFNDAWAYQGKEYAYTQGVSVEGLVYNKKIYRQLGLQPPTTLKAFYQVADKIKKAGKIPFALNIGASWPLQQWDKAPIAIARDSSYHEKMVNQKHPFTQGSPYEKSLAIARSIYQNSWAEPDLIRNYWDQSKKDFAEGKLAMYFLGSWVIPQLVQNGTATTDIGFIPFPFSEQAPTSKKPSVGLINKDWGVAVSQFSKNKTTAKAWLKFIFTKTDFADLAGFIPTDKRQKAKMPQLEEFQNYQPLMIQSVGASAQFIRLTNLSQIDFMRGTYIRDVLLSSDFEKSLLFLNRRWALSINNIENTQR